MVEPRDSGMTEIRRRISTPLSGVSGMPATVAEPDVGAMSVPRVRTVVVLPAPFGPEAEHFSVAEFKRDVLNAVRLPIRLVSRSAVSAGPLLTPPAVDVGPETLIISK